MKKPNAINVGVIIGCVGAGAVVGGVAAGIIGLELAVGVVGGAIVGTGAVALCYCTAEAPTDVKNEKKEGTKNGNKLNDHVLYAVIEEKDLGAEKSAESLYWATKFIWYGAQSEIPPAISSLLKQEGESEGYRIVQISIPKSGYVRQMARGENREITGKAEFEKLYNLASSKKVIKPVSGILNCKDFYRI